jgi:hypothetical protein
VPADARPHVLAVLREALSNVSRHANATRVDVQLTADNELLVQVRDNGRGLGDTTRQKRAAQPPRTRRIAWGSLHLTPAEPNGTVLEWRAPLTAEISRRTSHWSSRISGTMGLPAGLGRHAVAPCRWSGGRGHSGSGERAPHDCSERTCTARPAPARHQAARGASHRADRTDGGNSERRRLRTSARVKEEL